MLVDYATIAAPNSSVDWAELIGTHGSVTIVSATALRKAARIVFGDTEGNQHVILINHAERTISVNSYNKGVPLTSLTRA